MFLTFLTNSRIDNFILCFHAYVKISYIVNNILCTSSINIIKHIHIEIVDLSVLADILGMAGEDRRTSVVLIANPFIEVTDTMLSPSATQPVIIDRTPSPTDELLPWKNSPKVPRHRTVSETQYAETEVEELLSMLRETESLEEQGDILQYLVSYLLILIYVTSSYMSLLVLLHFIHYYNSLKDS